MCRSLVWSVGMNVRGCVHVFYVEAVCAGLVLRCDALMSVYGCIVCALRFLL